MQLLLLLFGVFLGATAAIFIKASTVHPVWMSSLRLFVAAVVLCPLFVMDLRKHRLRLSSEQWLRPVVPGLFLALHFMSWIAGVRRTAAVNSSLIVNMAPMVMPFILWGLVREKLSPREWVGTAIVSAGIFIMVFHDYRFDPAYVAGDLLCFVSMLLFAFYAASGRKNRDYPSLWLYVVPLYVIAGVFCAVTALVFGFPMLDQWTWHEALMVLGLGLLPTVGGHSILNNAMRHLRGQVVTTTNLMQTVFVAPLAFVFLGEVPQPVFYLVALVVALGVLTSIFGGGWVRRFHGRT